MKVSRFTSLSIMLLGLTAMQSALALDYRFSNLSTLGGNISYAKDINDKGQVVGYSFTPNNSNFRATLWQNGTATDLGALNNSNSEAYAINNAGQVVGSSYTGNSKSPRHATLWDSNGTTDLTPGNSNNAFAQDVNNAGQIVGKVDLNQPGNMPAYQPMRWEGTLATALPATGLESSANAISNTGQVVGVSTPINGVVSNSVIWNGPGFSSVNVLGNGAAFDVNDLGIAAGNALVGTQYQAALWDGNGIINLDLLSGTNSSTANGINNVGQAVGISFVDGKRVATLWDAGKALDLNNFLDNNSILAGWIMEEATSINNDGSIVGNASNAILGITSEAFVLTAINPSAVPLPGTLSFMLTGLAWVGMVKRRQQNKA